MGATIAAASHVTPVLSSLYSLASLLWVVPIPAPKGKKQQQSRRRSSLCRLGS
jgi:hypothetical protein